MVRKLIRRWLGLDNVNARMLRLENTANNCKLSVRDLVERRAATLKLLNIEEEFEYFPSGIPGQEGKRFWVVRKIPKAKA